MNVEIFRVEVQKRIAESSESAERLVGDVRQEVETVLEEIIDDCFGAFIDLCQQIKLVAREELVRLEVQTLTQIQKMLTVESNFIYQRKGFYEVILSKIADVDRKKENDKANPKDEL